MSAGKKNFLFPRRVDPRNRTCADLSWPLLALELVGLWLVASLTAPFTFRSEEWSRFVWMFLFVVPTLFILVGWRGLMSDRERKLASICLVLANFLLLGGAAQLYVAKAQEY